jgi:simple sugar transport system permease protein
MTSVQAPLEKADAFGPLKRFVSRRASWIPVFAALALHMLIFIAGQAEFGNFLTPRVI